MMILVHDPIGHYNREEALLIGRELEKLNMPIAATETIPMGIFSIPEYLLRRACDIVHCDTRFIVVLPLVRKSLACVKLLA